MDRIIVTTPEELKAIILNALEERSGSIYRSEPKKDVVDNISIDGAVSFLQENGYPTSKAKLYKLTALNLIPFGKYGRKLVFSKRALLTWAAGRVTTQTQPSEIAVSLAKSINQRK